MECWASIHTLAQLGRQSCQLHAPAALYPQGNSLVLIPAGGCVEPRSTVKFLKFLNQLCLYI